MLKKLLIASTAIAFSASAFAVAKHAVHNSPFYAGLNAGFGKMAYTGAGKNTGFTYGVDAGYLFHNNNYGVEFGFQVLPKVGSNVVKNNYIYDVALRYNHDFGSMHKWLVFGRLGAAVVTSKIAASHSVNGKTGSVNGFAGLMGVGLGYHLNQKVTLNVQGTVITKSNDTAGALSGTGGLTYHF